MDEVEATALRFLTGAISSSPGDARRLIALAKKRLQNRKDFVRMATALERELRAPEPVTKATLSRAADALLEQSDDRAEQTAGEALQSVLKAK